MVDEGVKLSEKYSPRPVENGAERAGNLRKYFRVSTGTDRTQI